MSEDQCAIHEVVEPLDNKSFLLCIECNHVFQTQEQLQKEFKELTGQVVERPLYCPWCLHDLYY